ncbi:MAG: MFS transporter [Ornithinimicrobium sp.]|uniref:MFS transporter n=1 Tax=Ornithinimicrobium sp. TaxID=1977084 RepID=UPI0026DF695D|nr:MFS transporter [Ornithinimicrobium sp.]MDO5739981.1 MFS transporter [Ornithinimicrobium sp.]
MRDPQMDRDQAGSRLPVLALVAVVIVGLNLRGPIAAVAPVLEEISQDVGLTSTTAGLLTTLPVLCFATLAPIAAALGRRFAPAQAVALGLVVMIVGLVLRVLGGSVLLLVGTVVIGVGMTIGNVLIPAVIKRDFPDRVAWVTAIFTGMLAGGAALTAAFTAPVSAVGDGWRFGLVSWVGLAVLGLAAWWLMFVLPERSLAPATTGVPGAVLPRSVWRQPMAWAVSLMLGFQATLYYSFTSWLPTLLGDEAGLGRAIAGNAMSIYQLLGIPATLVIPALCRRRADQRWLGVLLGLGWVVMVGGQLLLPGWWLLWAVVGGLTQGAGISLVFTLIVLRARDASTVRELSAMVQTVGYGMGASGPIVVGALNGATAGWVAPLLFLAAVAVALTAVGAVAGSDRAID